MIYNKRIINWGIIGCGDVTEVKSGPPYKLTHGFDLKAVMRRDEEKLKDYAKRHQVETYYTDADALINDSTIDAIYIATPPDTHKFYGLKVAKAKKACCIEKPLAPSYAESLAIFNAFKETNTPLFVAYYRRSLPRFLKIKEWLDNGYIGEVRHISWQLNKYPSNTDLSGDYNWRTDAKVASGGYFDDLASHGLDLFTFLLGNIKDVKGISLNQQHLYTANDAITACWIHDNGITGSGTWNFGCSTYDDKVIIYGSKGQIEFPIFKDEFIILKSDMKTESLLIENPKHVQMNHVENLKTALFSAEFTHPSTGETALHTSCIMDKILGKI